MAFRLTTTAFLDGGDIPKTYTCEGPNLAPPLEWSDEPTGTQSYALLIDDPDAPAGNWNHCLLFNIPATIHRLPEGFEPSAGTSGTNDFGKPGYGGPCPPKGHGPHRYYFKLFALDVPALRLKPGAKRSEFILETEGHVLGEAGFMGRYERK